MTDLNPEEAMLMQEYAQYMAWCRKWIAPRAVLSYEDFWRMAADNTKDEAIEDWKDNFGEYDSVKAKKK